MGALIEVVTWAMPLFEDHLSGFQQIKRLDALKRWVSCWIIVCT
jgi:hypothetical protein